MGHTHTVTHIQRSEGDLPSSPRSPSASVDQALYRTPSILILPQDSSDARRYCQPSPGQEGSPHLSPFTLNFHTAQGSTCTESWAGSRNGLGQERRSRIENGRIVAILPCYLPRILDQLQLLDFFFKYLSSWEMWGICDKSLIGGKHGSPHHVRRLLCKDTIKLTFISKFVTIF